MCKFSANIFNNFVMG